VLKIRLVEGGPFSDFKRVKRFNSGLPISNLLSGNEDLLPIERFHCHAMKNKIKNHSVDKVKKL